MDIAPTYQLKFQPATKPRSERAELLSKFLGHEIKLRDRKTRELRDATGHDIAIILGHVPTTDLYAFFRQCEQARSFGRYFWWALKPKRI